LILLAGFESGFLEKSCQRELELGDVEHCFDRAAGASASDQSAVSPLTEHQGEGTDQDRFAGAGFAGNDVETRLKFESQVRDQSEVFDAQSGQHDSGDFVGGRISRNGRKGMKILLRNDFAPWGKGVIEGVGGNR